MRIVLLAFLAIFTIACSNNANKPEQGKQIAEQAAEAAKISNSADDMPTDDTIFEGWEYLVLPVVETPAEFSDLKWNHFYGSLAPIKKIEVDDLLSCSWQGRSTYIYFSKEGHYANLSRSGYYYGNYLLHDNSVFFYPPLKIYRFDEEYAVDRLYYSNELHFVGSPVLRTDDETVVFSANGSIDAENGDTVRMYQTYCIKMWEKAKVNSNGVLYSLPNESSKNMFQDNYYGEKSSEAFILKLAKTTISNVAWYYTLFDFGGGEPTDGGGPFYEGWLPEECFE